MHRQHVHTQRQWGSCFGYPWLPDEEVRECVKTRKEKKTLRLVKEGHTRPCTKGSGLTCTMSRPGRLYGQREKGKHCYEALDRSPQTTKKKKKRDAARAWSAFGASKRRWELVGFGASKRHRRREANAVELKANYVCPLRFDCRCDSTPHRLRWCLVHAEDETYRPTGPQPGRFNGQRKKGKHC